MLCLLLLYFDCVFEINKTSKNISKWVLSATFDWIGWTDDIITDWWSTVKLDQREIWCHVKVSETYHNTTGARYDIEIVIYIFIFHNFGYILLFMQVCIKCIPLFRWTHLRSWPWNIQVLVLPLHGRLIWNYIHLIIRTL